MGNQDLQAVATAPAVAGSPVSSLFGRLADVIVAPGELFPSIKASKASMANWLVPALLSCLVGIGAAVITYCQPAIVQQLRDQQDQEIEKQVQSGKISASQAESAQAEADQFFGPTFAMLIGSFKAVAVSFTRVFLVGLGVWIAGTQLFDGNFSYTQAVEVSGLASLVLVLEAIISLFLVVATGTLGANLGPVLLCGDLPPINRTRLWLAALNVPVLWYLGVLAVGLGALSGMGKIKAAFCVFGPWGLVQAARVMMAAGHPT